jgi:pimeloyl-ACP methyl ester carboxylesterase
MKLGACATLALSSLAALTALAATRAGQDVPASAFEDRVVTVDGRRVHYLEWGSRDARPFVMLHGIGRSMSPNTQARLKASPNIEVVIVPDAGHYPHQETPDVFLAVVRAFFAG